MYLVWQVQLFVVVLVEQLLVLVGAEDPANLDPFSSAMLFCIGQRCQPWTVSKTPSPTIFPLSKRSLSLDMLIR